MLFVDGGRGYCALDSISVAIESGFPLLVIGVQFLSQKSHQPADTPLPTVCFLPQRIYIYVITPVNNTDC